MKLFICSLLLAQARAFFDSERTDIEIPEVNVDVEVTCGGDRIAATVQKNYIDRNQQWLGNGDELTLKVFDKRGFDKVSQEDMEACQGSRDASGNIVLEITEDFMRCGSEIETVTKFNEDGIEEIESYKFINHIIYQIPIGDSAMAIRQLDILKFECVYPVVQMTTGTMNPLVKSAVSKAKTKEIVGDMRLYQSANYTNFYTTPPVLALDEILYVEVNLERPLISDAFEASTDFAVVMEHCWGTPTQARDGQLKYFIIKNQCPVSGDPSLKVETNGMGLQSRFNIKMFKFIGEEYNDIWLHCTVRACNTTAGSCVPDCNEDGGKVRRSAQRRELPFVSFAKDIIADLPIQRKIENEDGEFVAVPSEATNNNILTPGSVQFNVLIAVIAIVLVLVFVFGVSFLVFNRRQPLK